MKNILILLGFLVSSILSNGQTVVTTANVNLRSEPTTGSSILIQIPKGTSLALSNCQSNWCSVTYSGYSGYIVKRFTGFESPSTQTREARPTEPVGHYTNSKGNTVQSPTHYDAVPDGATAECRDGTYSFSQSRRGTCSHHGGVKRWLK